MHDDDLHAAAQVVADAMVRPAAADGPRLTRALGRGVAFSDDLRLSRGGDAPDIVLTARARIDDAGAGRWRVDLRDSSSRGELPPWARASHDDARLAAVLAFSAFGDVAADARLTDAIELELDPHGWLGSADASLDPCFRAFAIARIYDAIAGALEKAWPDRGRAGSCSLGAIVVARTAHGELVDVVAGGRGGSPDGPGETWPGPLLPTGTLHTTDAIELDHASRDQSHGVGARNGGDGMLARYHLREPACFRVAIDRTTNPPHGLDRAGAGEPSHVTVIEPDGTRRPLLPWCSHLLERGNTVEVATAGGGGHGFPGWGDIDWDPSVLG